MLLQEVEFWMFGTLVALLVFDTLVVPFGFWILSYCTRLYVTLVWAILSHSSSSRDDEETFFLPCYLQ